MNTKRFLAVFLSVVMIALSLTACGSGDGKDKGTSAVSGSAVSAVTEAADDTADLSDYTYKSVVIIGVDGMGAFPKDADTPNMDRIFADGAVTYSARSATPSISAQAWASLMTGAAVGVHGRNNDLAESVAYESDVAPTIFKRVRDAMPDAVLASYCDWNPINVGIIEQDIGVEFKNAKDEVLYKDVMEYLKSNDPTLMYVHFDSCDAAGHGNGYGSETHLEQITTVDGYIGEVYDTLAENGKIEDTLFIVATDHGGTNYGDSGNHGGDSEEEMNIFFGVAGKTVAKGEIGAMNIRDVAAVVLYALGIQVPEFDEIGFSGQIPSGIFEGYTPGERVELVADTYDHKTLPTPDAESGKYVTDYLPEDKLDVMLHFDDSSDNFAEKYTTNEKKEPKYFTTGYFDKCIEVGFRGSVVIPDIKLEDDSFTLSMWFNHQGYTDKNYIMCGTQTYRRVTNKGFSLLYDGNSVRMNMGDGNNGQELVFPISELFPHGWTNFTVVVNREDATVTGYINFESVGTKNIKEELKTLSLDAGPMNVGNDGAGTYNQTNIKIDEFFIYSGVIDDATVAGLAEYYQYAK